MNARQLLAPMHNHNSSSTRRSRRMSSGRKRPAPETTPRLVRLLRAEARRILKRRPAREERAAAERFLESFAAG